MKQGLKQISILSLLVVALLVIAACGVVPQTGTQGSTQISKSQLAGMNVFTGGNYTFKSDSQSFINQNFTDNYIIDGDTVVSAIIELDGGSAFSEWKRTNNGATLGEFVMTNEGAEFIGGLEAIQRGVVNLMAEAQIDVIVEDTYTTLFNGLAVYGKVSEIRKIDALNGVKGYVLSDVYAAPTSVSQAEYDILTTGGIFPNYTEYQGEGMLVAVLDTGLDYKHPAFSMYMPYEDIYTAEDIAYRVEKGNLKGSYLNDKVAYAYDYADNDSEVYPTADHGTHVAGIIAANDDDEGIYGVVPYAQLAICKVFGDDGTGTTAMALAAVSDMALLGVDAINMSLGVIAGFSHEGTSDVMNKAYNAIEELGIILCASAGNEYYRGLQGTYGASKTDSPDYGVIGAPSSYASTFSVASLDTVGAPYNLAGGTMRFAHTDAADVNSNNYDFLTEILAGKNYVKYEYVMVGDFGAESGYEGLDVEGKIVVTQRGAGISFTDKSRIAAEHGAVACIIYNNAPGSIRMQVDNKLIPTCSVDMAVGLEFAQLEEKYMEFSRDFVGSPSMSIFSSWGPIGDLKLKPEITGFGGSIYSTIINGYGYMSGTSMSSPNVAGVVTALKQHLKEEHPELTSYQLAEMAYQILMSTAFIQEDFYGNPVSPRKQGAGLVDLDTAVETNTYLTVSGSNRTKLELGDDPAKGGIYTLRFNVVNAGEYPAIYDVDALTMTETCDDGVTIAMRATMLNAAVRVYADGKYVEDGVITVDAYDSVALRVVITLSDADKQYIDNTFKSGMYVEGFATLTSVDGYEKDLSIPWLAFYGDWGAVNVFDKTIWDEEDHEIYESVPLSVYGGTNLLPLGVYPYVLPEGYAQPDPSAEKNAISPAGLSGIYTIYMGLLSNAKRVDYKVTDSVTGEVIWEMSEEWMRKAMFHTNNAQIIPSYSLLNFEPDLANMYNNREYTVSVAVTKDWYNDEAQVWEFPFVFDTEAPVLTDNGVKLLTENGRTYMTVNAYDNHILSNIRFYNYDNGAVGNILSGVLPIYECNKGGDTALTYDITDYIPQLSGSDIIVYIEDYAMNYTAYIVSITDPYADFVMDGNVITGYKGEGGNITIPKASKIGDNAFKGNKTITGVVIENGLTEIGANAFADCTALETISLPASLTKIGAGAFSGLTALREIKANGTTPATLDGDVFDIPETAVIYVPTNALEAYKQAWLEVAGQIKVVPNVADAADFVVIDGVLSGYKGKGGDVIIPDNLGIVSVEASAFAENASITSVVLPEGMTHIVANTFKNCVNLEKVVFPTTYKTYYQNMFTGCVKLHTIEFLGSTLPTLYGPPAFLWSLNITPYLRFYVPADAVDTWKGFSMYVTKKCTDRIFATGTELNGFVVEDGTVTRYWDTNANVVLPEEATAISASAFAKNAYMESIDLNNVTAIPASAFQNATALKSITIPAGVTEIGATAFNGSALEVITVKGTTPATIGNNSFGTNVKAIFVEDVDAYKTAWSAYADKIFNVNDFEIEGNVIVGYNGSLENVIIPAGFEIGDNAFEGTSIKSVYAVNGLTTIGANAFANIASLEMNLPASVEEIGDGAFLGTKLVLMIEGNVPANVGENAFDMSNGTLIYVTPANMASYQKMWAAYASLIHSTSELIEEFVIENGVLVQYNGEGGEVIIPEGVTSIAESVFYDNRSITSVVMPEGLTTIGNYAFYQALNLVSVHFPSTLTTMGDQAFYVCSALENINLEDTKLTKINGHVFDNCRMIKRIILPDTVTRVEGYAFQYTQACEELVLSKNLVYVGTFAFSECGASELTLPDGIITISNYGFYRMRNVKTLYVPGSVQFPKDSGSALCFADWYSLEYAEFEEGITATPTQGFSGCGKLKAVKLPSTLEFLGWSGFTSCESLEEIDLSHTRITELTSSTFWSCSKLHTIKLPDTVTKFGSNEFRVCTALKNLTIPSSLKMIAANAFWGCTALTELDFSNTQLEDIYPAAFQGVSGVTELVFPATLTKIQNNAFVSMTSLKSVTFTSETAPEMGSGLFSDCPAKIYVPADSYDNYLEASTWAPYISLIVDTREEFEIDGNVLVAYNGDGGVVEIPGNITEIGEGAFAGTDITSISLPYGVEIIAARAFENCAELTTVIVNGDLVSIGARAFANATSLTELTIYSDNAPATADDAFAGVTADLIINVTEGTIEGYEQQAAYADVTVAELGFIIENGVLLQYIGNGGDVVIPDGVTAIASGVFNTNLALTSVVIPDGVTKIGDAAFANASNLVKVVMTDSVLEVGTACFMGCSSLSDLTFSKNIKTLPTELFRNCTALASFTISENVRIIGSTVFEYSGIEELIIPETVISIDYNSFYNATKIRVMKVYANITGHPQNAFANLDALEEMYFYGDVEKIQGWDFGGLRHLRIVEFHGHVGQIGNYSATLTDIMQQLQYFSFHFLDCPELERVEFFGDVDLIGGYSFGFCPKLSEVIFHGNVGTIDGFAFSNCSNLKQWIVAADNEYLVQDANGLMYNKDFTRLYRQPEYFEYEGVLVISNSVETIDDYAFWHGTHYCTKFNTTFNGWSIASDVNNVVNETITEVVLPANLKHIGVYAFSGLRAVTTITTAEGISTNELIIDRYAFANMANLKSIEIPANTHTIRAFAFMNCGLEAVNIPASVKVMSYAQVFVGCANIRSISLDPANTAYKMVDGALYSNDMKVLYFYSPANAAEELVVANGVEIISSNAFINNKHLTKITLPATLKIIGDKAFFGADNLTTYVFLGKAPKLESLYREGGDSYANFMDYVDNMSGKNLVLICNEANADSFNNFLWRRFFTTMKVAEHEQAAGVNEAPVAMPEDKRYF